MSAYDTNHILFIVRENGYFLSPMCQSTVVGNAVVSKPDPVPALMWLIGWWGSQILNQRTPLLGVRAEVGFVLYREETWFYAYV